MSGTMALRPAVAASVPLAAIIIPALLWIHFGVNPADEGFLWYGAQRTLAGEVPLRDFMAYDPGRYQWTALWMWIAGDDGIVVTRWAAVLFQALAVAAVSVAVWRETRDLAITWLVGICAVLLMKIWYSRYEPSVALMQVVVLAGLVGRPRGISLFAGGLQVGLSAYMGRNLGLYGLIGLAVMLALMQGMDRGYLTLRRLMLVVAGGAIGLLPFAAMSLFVPGFAAALWQSVMRLIEFGSTNLHLPVPWPWLQHAGDPWLERLTHIVSGILFLLAPVIGVTVAGYGLLRNRRLLVEHPIVTSAAILTLPYAHYIFSRADLEHLQRGGAPLVVALALLPAPRRSVRILAASVVLAAVLLSMGLPRSLGSPENCVDVSVGSDRLCVESELAATVEGARVLVDHLVRPGESVLIAPFDVTLYAALGLRAPHWEIYATIPASPALERAELERLEGRRTRLFIIALGGVDGRAELSYPATHPMIASYLQTAFVRVPQTLLPGRFVVGLRAP